VGARRRAVTHPAAPGVTLDGFTIERQRHMNWCWAAVGASLSRYYGETLTQCEVANRTLGLAHCCDEPDAPECARTWFISNTLRDLDLFADARENPLLTYAEIRAELAAGHPVVCDMAWFGGGRHVVCIVGCADEGERLTVHDPADGEVRSMPYEQFRNAYRGMARWLAYFTTRPPAAGIAPRPLMHGTAFAEKEERHVFAATIEDVLAHRILANAREVSRGSDPARVLQIPAVFVSALWLEDDTLAPLAPAPPPLVAGQAISERAFTNSLEPLARTRANSAPGEV
jgi:Papain-like cysteine protease AvrRpt2